MTVIQPNKDRGLTALVVLMGSLLTLAAFLNIAIYSKTVILKQDIAGLDGNLMNLRQTNAELRDKFYQETNPQVLTALAGKDGLIKEGNPQWAFVSRY
ncbi:MAG TPA: hypothetical protein VMU70_01465 [Candidatus Tyrphobacter sp.]|nr:hypothetical protein [Candidatus Tyrphobacter sp.]